MKTTTKTAMLIAGLAVLYACGGDEGSSRVVVYADAGEEAVEGLPAEEFADGFAVTYERVVLALSGFTLRASDGDDAMLESQSVLVSLLPDAAQAFVFEGVPGRRWDEVSFRTAPPPADVSRGEDVDEAVAQQMIDEGWSQLVEGTLTAPDGSTYPFSLGFDVTIDYARCISGLDGTQGLVVPSNGQADATIEWHLEHIFFDSFAEDSELRAEAIAAAWDGTNPIDFEDLATQDLANLRGLDGELLTDEGGAPVLYVPPPGGADTLAEHVAAARFGHWNGIEGECMTEQL